MACWQQGKQCVLSVLAGSLLLVLLVLTQLHGVDAMARGKAAAVAMSSLLHGLPGHAAQELALACSPQHLH